MAVHIQNEGECVMAPASYSAAGTSQFFFDCSGYGYAEVDVLFGALATNGGVPSVLRITESDATVITNFVTIAAGATPTLAASNLGSSIVKFQIDLRKRKRYLNLDITNGTTTLVIGAVARLSRPAVSKDSASAQSVSNLAATSGTAVSQIVQF